MIIGLRLHTLWVQGDTPNLLKNWENWAGREILQSSDSKGIILVTATIPLFISNKSYPALSEGL